MNLGKMTITEAYLYLKPIADSHGLKLNRAHDLKLARIIFANLWCNYL